MTKVEEYRRHAQECRTLADKVGTEYERQLLIGMAQDWTSLAKGCEGHSLNDPEFFRRIDQGAIKGPDVV
jgi:hypothetical protein